MVIRSVGGAARSVASSGGQGAVLRWTKSITAVARSSPLSSWRKWPASVMVVWFWPDAPGHQIAEEPSAPWVMGSSIAERAQERLVELAEDLPRPPVGVGRRDRRGATGTSTGNWRAPSLYDSSGNGRVVGRDHLGREVGHASAAHDASHGQRGHLLGEFLPGQEGLAHVQVAGGQAGVGRHHPPEPVGMLGHEAQADEATPVLADEGDVGQLELVEERGAHPLHVAGIGVVATRAGLVRATEAHQVGRDDPEARARERPDHLAVQIAPRRLAVHEQDLLCTRGGALVEIVHPETAGSFSARDLHVVRSEVEPGQRRRSDRRVCEGCSWSSSGRRSRQCGTGECFHGPSAHGRRPAEPLELLPRLPRRRHLECVEQEPSIGRASGLELGGEGRLGAVLGATPALRASSAATVGELRAKSSAERRTGAVAWYTTVRWRTTRAHSLVDRERRGDRPDMAPVPLFLDLHRVVEDRFEVVEVVEHEPQRHAGPFRDASSRGLGVTLLEEGDQGLGEGPPGSLAARHPPVCGRVLDDRHHDPILRNLHSRCKKFGPSVGTEATGEVGREAGAVVSGSVRVVVCKELGPLDNVVVEERATPVPGPGQVIVDVRAAGVNYVDGLICQGRYQMKPAVPYVPGGEIAGVVSAVGDGVTRVQVGDRVMAMTGFGAFAEQVAVAASSLDSVPDALGFSQAATFIQSYCTAWFALARRTTVTEGEWVLVLGAGRWHRIGGCRRRTRPRRARRGRRLE